MILAAIPSPAQGVWHLGPVPLRAYALCIIAGVIAAVLIGERRWIARGGSAGTVSDIAVVAVPVGIVGARIYHVVTSPRAYLDDPVQALKIWEGGLGVWGGIAGGALAVWLLCRRRGISTAAFGDAVAPGVLVAQAIGRLGNYFNQELYGRPTDLPWALEITRNPAVAGESLYHPTFLYEALWNLGAAGVVLWADRRYRLGRGRVFALYVALYCAGRLWIEALRIDEANRILGLRLNIWTSLLVGGGALAYFVLRRGGREESVELDTPRSGATTQDRV